MSGYANIEKAALEIAYDNGSINRGRSENDALAELHRFLDRSGYATDQLSNIDDWLGNLSDDDLQTVCAGEEQEADAILRGSPIFTLTLLTDIFENVC